MTPTDIQTEIERADTPTTGDLADLARELLLHVGDTVLWRGGWGLDAPREAVVTHIETHEVGGYGYPADQVPWSEVRGCVVDLDNGKWAYGDQLERVQP